MHSTPGRQLAGNTWQVPGCRKMEPEHGIGDAGKDHTCVVLIGAVRKSFLTLYKGDQLVRVNAKM